MLHISILKLGRGRNFQTSLNLFLGKKRSFFPWKGVWVAIGPPAAGGVTRWKEKF